MKKKMWLLLAGLFLLITIVVFSIAYFGWYQNINHTNNPLNETKDVILYYGSTCTHCKAVEQYMTENKIDEKIKAKGISIIRKEIFDNMDNKLEFELVANYCNLKEFQKGVPLVFYSQKCYVGDTDVLSILDEISNK